MTEHLKYRSQLLAHYASSWGGPTDLHEMTQGPTADLPEGFCVAEFSQGAVRKFSTVGMAEGQADGIEVYLITPTADASIVELLYSVAHYDRTGARLGLGHTVNFGRPVWSNSSLDYGFLSYPYLERDGFEQFRFLGTAREIAWLIPISRSERDFKKERGVEALEERFELTGLDYANPERAPVV